MIFMSGFTATIKPTIKFILLAFACALLFSPNRVVAQKQKISVPLAPPALVRTTTRNETRRLGYGGTLTLIAAPEGSITIEGWSRSEVEVRAEIQMRADTEADLDRLAAVNGFLLDEDLNHLRVLTTGTHDRAFVKAHAKNFPRKLLGLPWKIDYRIRVPMSVDLDINAGRGPISLKSVEGNVRVSSPQSETSLEFAGGTVSTTIAAGRVTLKVLGRSWHGVGADIKVAAGDIVLELPAGFSGDLDADILRSGEIEVAYEGLEAREKPGITKQHIKGRLGSGGAFLKLTVGDGRIYIKKQESKQ
ncbi:MAG TPA: hypothetical protein DC047_00490 [Blastocatellia bacterium]|nr:hypothetical protein [Blastocatellia bacterium]